MSAGTQKQNTTPKECAAAAMTCSRPNGPDGGCMNNDPKSENGGVNFGNVRKTKQKEVCVVQPTISSPKSKPGGKHITNVRGSKLKHKLEDKRQKLKPNETHTLVGPIS